VQTDYSVGLHFTENVSLHYDVKYTTFSKIAHKKRKMLFVAMVCLLEAPRKQPSEGMATQVQHVRPKWGPTDHRM